MEEGEEEGPASDSGGSDTASAEAGGDRYDCADPFIDDTEAADDPRAAGKAKHEGFYINKARLTQR